MPFFKYKAKDKEGKLYERTVETKNRFDVYRVIREEGGSVVSIKEKKSLVSGVFLASIFNGIKTQEKINLAKNLGMMMDAGLPVTRALSVMVKQSRREPFRKLVGEIEADVSRGQTLSESLNARKGVFPPLFVSMVRAGEESGNVSGALQLVSGQMEKSYLLAKKARGALIYPGVVISIMIVISILLLIYMVPTLTETFEGIGADLPATTVFLIAASNFLVNNTLVVIAGFLALIAGGLAFFKSAVGHRITDVAFIRLPIIGPMIKEFEAARTARALSSLLSAGVEIVVALDVTIDVVQNHLYKNVLNKVRSAVEKGDPMSSVFIEYEHLYPVFVAEMVAVGEETGKIAQMLMGAASFYEEEVDQKTKNLSTIIEPLLMVVIGAGVGFFAISMLAPTYSLVDYI